MFHNNKMSKYIAFIISPIHLMLTLLIKEKYDQIFNILVLSLIICSEILYFKVLKRISLILVGVTLIVFSILSGLLNENSYYVFPLDVIYIISCFSSFQGFYRNSNTIINNDNNILHMQIQIIIRSNESEDIECPICLSELDSALILPCTHKFHEICLLEWFNKQKTCPTCREIYNNYQIK